MDYDSLINSLGDIQYLLTNIPYSVSVESVKLDKSGIEIILACGIDEFAEANSLEIAEELFMPENGLPACLVNLATTDEFPVRVWQFTEAKEGVTE